jgi:uncharacterized Zn finger protein
MEATLHALSSDGDTTYAVAFTYVDGVLTVRCACKAGEFGKYCKHVGTFLAGDSSLLADPSEAPTLASVAEWAAATGYESRCSELTQLEMEIEKAKAKVKRMKTQLWQELYRGLKG